MAGGLPSYRHPDGAEELAKELVRIQVQIDALRRAIGAGLVVDGQTGDLHVAGSRFVRLGSKDGASGAVVTSSFDGTDFAHPGTQGNYFGDDGAVLNELFLRPGSIGNDKLTDPILTQTFRAAAQGFALGVPWAEKAGRDITVPDGFTQASVQVMGRMYAVNQNTSGGADTTGTDALYVQIGIDGHFSSATPTGVSGNFGFASTVGVDSFDLAGLTPGNTIRLSAQGSCGYQPIAAYPDNYIVGVASITWLR